MTRALAIALLVLCTEITLSPNSAGQTTSIFYRRSGLLSGGNISTVLGNWGVIGQPASGLSPRGAWLHPNNGYIGDLSIFVGLELPVRDYNGDTIPDTVHSVVTCPVLRPTLVPDVDPVTGASWTFEPDSGFATSGQSSIALSNNPLTWPSLWPDHPEWGAGVWHGLSGPNTFAGDHEAFFRMSDDNDLRFNVSWNNPRGIAFRPDTVNLSRTGHGISVSVWYILIDSPPFGDLLFRVFDISNTSTWRYDKVVFGTLAGTYVGVTGVGPAEESTDDAAVLLKSQNMTLAWDFDHDVSQNTEWRGRVGKFGEAILQAPGGETIASYNCQVPGVEIRLGDDQWLWESLSPGSFVNPPSIVQDTVPTIGEDMDYLYGTEYFSLDRGETRRIASVIAYGYTREEVWENTLYAKMLWNAGFNQTVVREGVRITNFDAFRVLSGVVPIMWNSQFSGGTVDIWFSPDGGGSDWIQIAARVPNSGTFDWNTATGPDCSFGKLKIFAYDDEGNPLAFWETFRLFRVDNPGNGAPAIRILDGAPAEGQLVTEQARTLALLVGDPEGMPLTVSEYYRTNQSETWSLFDTFPATPDTLPLMHTVPLSNLPNAEQLQLKFTVSDGFLTQADSTSAFNKQTPRTLVPAANITHLSGPAEAQMEVRVVQSSLVKPDVYLITFDDTTVYGETRFNVYNQTQGAFVLRDSPLRARQESESFDGLALYADQIITTFDTLRSGWNRPPGAQWSLSFMRIDLPLLPLYGYPQPADYTVIFDSIPIDTSVGGFDFFVAEPIPYTVINERSRKRVPVLVSRSPGIEELLFVEDVGGEVKPTWDLFLVFGSLDSTPARGDTLYLFTRKAYSFYDTLKIEGVAVSVREGGVLPISYAMHQSYPNPFNPAARIRFSIPAAAYVVIEVYNIVGQRVMVLQEGVLQAGTHEVLLDGSRLSSGVYFYRMRSGSFVASRKAVLLK